MKTVTRRLGLTVAALGLMAAEGRAAPRWYQAETPHFEVYSSANKAETRAIISDLELFHQTITAMFSIQQQSDRKTRIVIFGRERDLEPYKPDGSAPPDDSLAYDVSRRRFIPVGAQMMDTPEIPRFDRINALPLRVQQAKRFEAMRAGLTGNDGKMVAAAPDAVDEQHAYSVTHPDETLIVMSGEDDWENSKATLYGRHMVTLLQNAGVEGPRWFLEGMAELMATFDIRRETCVVGRTSGELLGFIRQISYLMPWQDFFAVAADSREYQSVSSRDLFSGQAWLLMHYCYFSEERSAEWRAGLLRWMEDVQRGEGDMVELLQRHLGVTPEQLTAELLAYAQGDNFPGLMTERPDSWAGEKVKLDRVAKDETENVLLDVRVRVTRDPEAVQELQARAERDPSDVDALRLLGVDAMLRGDEAAQTAYWNQAKAAGSTEAAVVRQGAIAGLRARLEHVDPADLIPDEQVIVWRAELEEALRLDPSDEISLQWLAWLEALAETPSVPNMNRVQRAVMAGLAQPDFALMAVAIMRARIGDLDTAREITTRFADWDRWEWRQVVDRVSAVLKDDNEAAAKPATRTEG